MGADEADGEAPESRGVFRAVAGTDAAAVLVECGVEDVMDGFDAPVPAIESPQLCSTTHALKRGAVRLLISALSQVRLFEYTGGERVEVIKRVMAPGASEKDIDFDHPDASDASDPIPDLFSGQVRFAEGAEHPFGLDVTVDPDYSKLSIEIDSEPLLDGQDLSNLANVVAPTVSALMFEAEAELAPEQVYMTAVGTASHLRVAKSTVTRRILNNRIIGFQVFKRGLRIPRDQFMGRDVVPGVAEILELFRTENGGVAVDHKAAWAFLGSNLYPGDVDSRPIDRLRRACREHTTRAVVDDLALAKSSLDYGNHFPDYHSS